MDLRKIEEIFFRILMFCSTVIIAVSLIIIIFSTFYKGLPHLTWEMISKTPKGGFYFGKEGGILNAIVGSLYLSFGATILAILFGLPLALFLNVHIAHRRKLVNVVRFVMDLLWGVPSIVYGAFGFTIMVFFGIRASLLAGIITVTLFIIPIMVRGIDEVLQSVPRGLHESSLSLGSTRAETAYKVFLKQSVPGVVTAILLSFGRAIGDAASILFTTGYTDHIPTSLSQPTATLPLAIFFQLSSPIPQVRDRAYAAAAVLFIIILIISILSRFFSKRYQKNKINF
ncbi:MAG: phosphate ABC transporter permease PstA [Bacteroidales bacterium]|jgi:phosphate transport system permease protein|nr:phosphate ABC transporter permease PstA [Bacteroidales bacterium]MDI9592038.1 phosphate ABC transporter permease PstA [Bacteroidota bacterium]NLH33486.1 phosphate ABC transporter permease PstA [Lentimicrobium sp.]MBP7873664.1 phosphate ABC transporter permease PstA [Bacteroidales bacterium]MCO6469197.1 phosphate ABC transporter permease PstA [Bacteroidales bacterium]